MGSESLKRTFKNLPLALRRKFGRLTHKQRVELHHEYYNGGKLDLHNPRTFNEKINWLKIYYQPPILKKLVDKIAVRDFVSARIGDEYLNEVLGIYHHADEIDFSELPERFVIKGAHGCHYNLIVPDKSKLDRKRARRLFQKWLGRDYYNYTGGEWAYKDIPRRLVAEKFLQQGDQNILNDYKFFCFNGEPRFVQVDIDRDVENYRCYYNIEWDKLEFGTERNKYYQDSVERPKVFEEMVMISKKLSQGFPFVRVDLYDINGKTVFGELTFYPADGRKAFTPHKYNRIIGDMLELPDLGPERKPVTTFSGENL